MKILVLGAGIMGTCTAWHLLERGHEVTVVERQGGAALETSFANAGQISVSYCEPWANRSAPLKMLKWMLQSDAPLLFRPQLDWQQWRWGLQFLGQCNDRAFERNVAQLVALGAYSHAALKQLVAQTGLQYHRLERGIAHYFTTQAALDDAGAAAQVMQSFGVQRRVVTCEELLRIEPALQPFAAQIRGGTYTPTDESGDAHAFTQGLAQLCAQRGAVWMYGHDIERLQAQAGAAAPLVLVRERASGRPQQLRADAVVVACGSYSGALLRGVGVDLPIYPGKGYSATLDILRPEAAPNVSMIDDAMKCAITRLGTQLRVAGTIELNGYNLALDTALARARCQMLTRRVERVMPGVCDTREAAEGGNPRYWCGLRPATPTNIPFIGGTRVRGLWVNAGHGTLGWTHGAGSGLALAQLISGERPETAFQFMGQAPATAH